MSFPDFVRILLFKKLIILDIKKDIITLLYITIGINGHNWSQVNNWIFIPDNTRVVQNQDIRSLKDVWRIA